MRDAGLENEISVRRSCHGLYISDGVHPFGSAGTLPRPAAGLLLDVVEHDPFGMMLLRMIVSENSESDGSEDHAKTRANCARTLESTTNVVLFEQRLVARLVLPLDVVEKRAARLHELQQAAA